ncbi:hypothetical protein AnigIFM60653_003118 [Aspergillus niger]|nr:hypothetical protein AnigIFM50267_000929 [Aspergillus niger]GLA03485.1 hypothetical protein AnigIFM60653_003118 [Aspergillus niger]GLA43134.1 hypothetical protein AnigIFM63309_000860 [Aspergillus niger]
MDSPRLKAEEIPISTQSPSNNIVVPTLDAYAMIRMVVAQGREDSNWPAGDTRKGICMAPKTKSRNSH